MKYLRIFFAIAMVAAVLAGAVPGVVKAQQFTSYTSGINVQNLSSTDAGITLHFYDQGTSTGTGGTETNPSVDDTILGGSVKSYFPLNVANGFSGSMVITSDQPLAAVVNVANSSLTALGAYDGKSSGSTTVYLPILHRGNGTWFSWYSVQNTDSAAIANVDIDYSSTGVGVDKTIQVAPGAAVNVYQKDEAFGTAKFFAAKLTSNLPIVVSVIQENPSNILVYTGFDAGTPLPVMPTINTNNSGYFTGTQIYNLGTVATDVTVTYSAGLAGTDCTEKQTIPASTMNVFTTAAFSAANPAGITTNCTPGQRFVGGGRVTTNSANQPLAVVVNQLKGPSLTNGSAYGGFDATTATSSVYMPTIFDRNSKWWTAFNLTNVGNTTTFVKCTYANSTKTHDTGSAGLAAGKAVTFAQGDFLADRYVGSAVCKTYTDNSYATVDTNGKIVATVNELGPGSPDNLLSYEGINGQ